MFRMHNDIYKVRRAADALTAAPSSENAATEKTKVRVGGGNRGLKFQDAVQYVNLMMSPSDLFHSLGLIS
jgi:hypothetical protein